MLGWQQVRAMKGFLQLLLLSELCMGPWCGLQLCLGIQHLVWDGDRNGGYLNSCVSCKLLDIMFKVAATLLRSLIDLVAAEAAAGYQGGYLDSLGIQCDHLAGCSNKVLCWLAKWGI